jgi:hypothetical protein
MPPRKPAADKRCRLLSADGAMMWCAQQISAAQRGGPRGAACRPKGVGRIHLDAGHCARCYPIGATARSATITTIRRTGRRGSVGIGRARVSTNGVARV